MTNAEFYLEDLKTTNTKEYEFVKELFRESYEILGIKEN